MALFNQQPSYPTNTPTSNKKTIIIAVVAIFGVSLLAALIAGIFAPGSQTTPTQQSGTIQKDANGNPITVFPSETTDEATVAVSPQTQSSTQTPSQPGFTGSPEETPQYQYVPDPTIDIDKLVTEPPMSPTPTPLPGPFYIPNGKQNDLILKLYLRKDWDLTYEVQLINTRTREVRVIGYQYSGAPGDSVFFNKDFSQVIFLGGNKKDYQQVSIYSIGLKRVIKVISLEQIKAAIPSLQIQKSSTLSQMVLSPDFKKVALSYGNTFDISLVEPNTNMIVINLTTNKMQLLPAKGLVRNWKDASTIQYTPGGSTDPNKIEEIKTTLP